MHPTRLLRSAPNAVSVLFSEPKIPQSPRPSPSPPRPKVSVLFSEPKIPQSPSRRSISTQTTRFQCSSASRKFLNRFHSDLRARAARVSVLFSEPKIPQCGAGPRRTRVVGGFSALQRAENSSIYQRVDVLNTLEAFQCSSASRKFLNQQNSRERYKTRKWVSVLFSEPKIPQ